VLWCSRRLLHEASSHALVRTTSFQCFSILFLHKFATTPKRQVKFVKRLDQATRLASALVVFATVCVTCDARLSTPSQGAAVFICHLLARGLPDHSELAQVAPWLSRSLSTHRILHLATSLTSVPFCRVYTRERMLQLY
jgi:hypothetical protein